MNYRIKIDLLKLKDAFVRELKGNAETKKCVIIPIDECNGMFLGEKGCYLSLTALEMKESKYYDTHCIKVDIPRERREAMTDEERRAMPILGGLHAIEPRETITTVVETIDKSTFVEDNEKLPF